MSVSEITASGEPLDEWPLITSGGTETGEEKGFIRITIEDLERPIRQKFDLPKEKIKEAVVGYAEYSTKKEHYFITAIRNLIRKTNILELYQQVLDNQITEDDFHSAISNEPGRYILEIKELDDPSSIRIIVEIAHKIKFDLRDFSVNDMSELFSVDLSRFIAENDLLHLK